MKTCLVQFFELFKGKQTPGIHTFNIHIKYDYIAHSCSDSNYLSFGIRYFNDTKIGFQVPKTNFIFVKGSIETHLLIKVISLKNQKINFRMLYGRYNDLLQHYLTPLAHFCMALSSVDVRNIHLTGYDSL